MKKALALVLALVLALSVAVSAFALELKDLTDLTPVEPGKLVVTVVDADDKEVLYVDAAGTYYIALTDEAWTDVKVTANGCVSAELVEFDPAKMIITGNLVPVWGITMDGVLVEEAGTYTVYEEALEAAATLNNESRTTYFGIVLLTNVNVIKVTVADNFGVSFTEGTIKIEAKKDGKNYGGTVNFINDVTIFEYEMVKWAAANYNTANALEGVLKGGVIVGEGGYSDYLTYLYGYDVVDGEYIPDELRKDELAAVISTTAFRAIEGKNIRIYTVDGITVEILNVAKNQKGVNFLYYGPVALDANGLVAAEGYAEKIEFGFYGEQVIASDFVVSVNLGINWYDLRELFGLKVEEDDIITYYLLKDGKVVKEYKVDYMTANLGEIVEFEVKGSNTTLGDYELVLEVPAVEGESNPNTGAESVVGVVAALAVVSLASAAAVSLKK